MQQQGGSPYGVPPPPDMSTLFSSPPLSDAAAAQQQQQQAAAESASPINTRPPPQPQQQLYSAAAAPNYEELGAAADDSLCPEEGAGGLGGVSGSGGNRWPRQETLALLKIRSDMDAVFRDATLKGPLWEEVSRKLGDLGYSRSAKKCKEKFENVHKYYKRTKEGRAGRQDGKSYRFFSQLEALHSTTAAANSVFLPAGMNTSSAAPIQPVATAPAAARFPNPQQVSAPTPIATAPPPHLPPMPMPMLGHENPSIGAAVAAAGLSFSSNTSSDASESEGDEEEDDDEATEEGPSSGKKRKREGSGGGEGGRKMMAFFEGMMRQVMERQEAMQQRFLEVIEKREQDRAIREEAWRRQEMVRIDREHEVVAGERAAAAARDAAVISFLQKVTGQTLPVPQHTTTTTTTTTTSAALPPAPIPAPAPVSIVQTPPPLPTQPQPQQQQQLTPPPSQRQQQPPPPPSPQQQNTEMHHQQYHQTQQQTPSLPPPPMCPTSSELVPISSEPPQDGGAAVSVSLDPSSSRWPKTEVHALINLRSGLDSRYQESGPKGPLWEEISAGMKRLGYNRSSKRCKEKWENINKYFKKVKEGNKKRPEDAKTCPYFHQLDALYRSKHLTGVPGLTQGPQEQESTHRNPNPNPNPISVMPPASQQQQLNQGQTDIKKGNGGITDAGAGGGPSDCRMPATPYSGNGDNSASGMMKKPEDIVKELMSQPNDDYGRADDPDSDNMDEDDEEDDEEDEDGGKSQYTIQFQRPNVGGGNGTGSSAATAPSSGGKAPGSFLAMVR